MYYNTKTLLLHYNDVSMYLNSVYNYIIIKGFMTGKKIQDDWYSIYVIFGTFLSDNTEDIIIN